MHNPGARTAAQGVRAGIIVTGTEVLTGLIQDRNGPWLSKRLREHGADVVHITFCRDRPEDLRAQLEFMTAAGVDLIVTSGGLGPTADDLTTAVVSEFCERPMFLDERLVEVITEIIKPFIARFEHIDKAAMHVGTLKQATVPEGAAILGPAGTAPGLVVTAPEGVLKPTVVVLPGPPGELQNLWPEVIATEQFGAVLRDAVVREERMLRLFGIPESEIAQTLRDFDAETGLDGLEVTTCLRKGEIEIAVSFDGSDMRRYEAFEQAVVLRHGEWLFSTDGHTIEEAVVKLLGDRKLALAESCTGGMIAARLTDSPGASEYFAGGVVSYSNQSKSALLGVDEELIKRHGAVSVEVAAVMATGALDRFDAGAALSVTGIAGPEGDTEGKPVGTVCFCACDSSGAQVVRELHLPGRRSEVRERSVTVGLHLLCALLTGRDDVIR